MIASLSRPIFPVQGADPGPRPCQAPGADPDAWFPEPGDAVAAAAAKALCAACPDRAACLAGALARNEEHGVWGGLTEHERLPLLAASRARELARSAGGAA
jgi:WhiB family redox-sensing transcriptional regulator